LKIFTLTYYFFRSLILRGLWNTGNLFYQDIRQENEFKIHTSSFKNSDSQQFFHYQGAGYLVLSRIFKELKTYTDFSFVDIGSGRGRVIFAAERAGFNDLTGIELDEELVDSAKENLKIYPFKRNESVIRFLNENALTFKYKNEPAIYFLFNPFNEEILKEVLSRIESATSGPTVFVYMNPLFRRAFERTGITRSRTIKTRFYTEAIIYKMNFEESGLH
jgi:SAM-dependent methyltransferase